LPEGINLPKDSGGRSFLSSAGALDEVSYGIQGSLRHGRSALKGNIPQRQLSPYILLAARIFGRFADTIVNAQKTSIAGYKAAQSAIQIDQNTNHQAKQKREIHLKFEQTNEME
jgi:hypothetical protein